MKAARPLVGLCVVALLVALGVGILAGTPGARATAVSPHCRLPEGPSGSVTPLPHVAAALRPGGTLRVLGVGSATMLGPEASLAPGTVSAQSPGGGAAAATASPSVSERSFARVMAATLQRLVPGARVEVTVRGGRGLSAAEMLPLLKSALGEQHFELVLWQTGTVEAVRNLPPSEFAQTLADGAEMVAGAGTDLVLIDPQFSRFLQTNSNLDPYAQALQQTAAMPGVMLFHRFELMRVWAADGQIDLERTPKAERRQAVEVLHACLGQALARQVLAGAGAKG